MSRILAGPIAIEVPDGVGEFTRIEAPLKWFPEAAELVPPRKYRPPREVTVTMRQVTPAIVETPVEFVRMVTREDGEA